MLDTIREIVEDLASQQPEPVLGADGREGTSPPKYVLLGCPARDEADELALEMFRHLLRPQGYEVEVLSSKILTAEVLERIGNECPGVVVIASLPPGGLAQARYLCKRLRSQCSTLKVAVGRWGDQDNAERVEKRLKASGADFVSTTLLESRTQVVPLLQVAAAAPSVPQGTGAKLTPAGTAS